MCHRDIVEFVQMTLCFVSETLDAIYLIVAASTQFDLVDVVVTEAANIQHIIAVPTAGISDASISSGWRYDNIQNATASFHAQ